MLILFNLSIFSFLPHFCYPESVIRLSNEKLLEYYNYNVLLIKCVFNINYL